MEPSFLLDVEMTSVASLRRWRCRVVLFLMELPLAGALPVGMDDVSHMS